MDCESGEPAICQKINKIECLRCYSTSNYDKLQNENDDLQKKIKSEKESSIANFLFQFMRNSNQLFVLYIPGDATKKYHSECNEVYVCIGDNKNVL